MKNHYFIEPIKAFVKSEQILDTPIQKLTECEIIGFCTYVGEHITAIIKLSDGVVFDYIPFSSLCSDNTGGFESEAVIYNCPDLSVTIQETPNNLRDVQYTNKDKLVFTRGKSIYLIDFYESNELFVFIVNENGGFAMRPLHKTLFNTEVDGKSVIKNKKYIKQRNTYKG